MLPMSHLFASLQVKDYSAALRSQALLRFGSHVPETPFSNRRTSGYD